MIRKATVILGLKSSKIGTQVVQGLIPISPGMVQGSGKSAENATILVVDDHSMTRTLVRSILKGVGYGTVVQAESGASALALLKTQTVDLIICDWNMPNGNGLELLQALRAKDFTKKLPFLMLTAEAYRENVKAAAEAGVSDYVVKPFSAETLVNKVEEILKRLS